MDQQSTFWGEMPAVAERLGERDELWGIPDATDPVIRGVPHETVWAEPAVSEERLRGSEPTPGPRPVAAVFPSTSPSAVGGTDPVAPEGERPPIPAARDLRGTPAPAGSLDAASGSGPGSVVFPVVDRAARTESVESGRAPALALFDEISAAACAPVADDDAREFAARFTADYLSWDADFPYTRYRCLQPYFAHDAAATLGWDGHGRQDVNLVIPGAVVRLDARHVVVAVTARVVLHVRDGSAPSAAEGHEELPVPPGLDWASASPLGGGAWRPVATAWTVLRVPVGRSQDGDLVVEPHMPPAAPRGGGAR